MSTGNIGEKPDSVITSSLCGKSHSILLGCPETRKANHITSNRNLFSISLVLEMLNVSTGMIILHNMVPVVFFYTLENCKINPVQILCKLNQLKVVMEIVSQVVWSINRPFFRAMIEP